MNVAIRLSALVLSSTVVLLAGCGSSPSAGSGSGGSGGSGSSALASGGATSVYVVQNSSTGTSSSILQFSASSTGTVSPAATLSPPTSMIVDSVATDSTGQIYVGGSISTQYEILVYAAGATGSATPLRTITLSNTTGIAPDAMTVDAAGLLYVTGFPVAGTPGVAIYSANANGAAAPVRLIQGALTQLSSPLDLAVDASGNIYVANPVSANSVSSGSILVFASTANGNVAPTRTITNAAAFEGIAVDPSGNIYAIEDTATSTSTTITTTAALVEFSPTASGAATPIKTISGSSTGLTFGGGMSRDSAGNLYLMNVTFTTSLSSAAFNVLGFGPNAQGNVAPGINFSSSALTSAGADVALK